MIRQMTFLDEKKANDALNKLTAIAVHVGVATIGDLYEASSKPNTKPNNEFGWYKVDMYQAYIEEFNGKYILRLPEPKPVEFY